MSLTNFHIDLQALRNDDCDWYLRCRNRLLSIREEKNRNRSDAQAKYRAKRKQRLEICYRSIVRSEEETIEEEKFG